MCNSTNNNNKHFIKLFMYIHLLVGIINCCNENVMFIYDLHTLISQHIWCGMVTPAMLCIHILSYIRSI